MNKPTNKRVDLIILDKSDKISAAKILRDFNEKSFRELISCVESGQPIFLAELVPEQFYKSIRGVVAVIEGLESNQISYDVFINGEPESKEALLKIKNKVEDITLKDFR